MKKKLLIIGVILALLLGGGITWYVTSLKSPVKESEPVSFVIKSGTGLKAIVANLKEAKLIKNEISAYIYIYLNGKTQIQAGQYNLNRNMSLGEIWEVLSGGGNNENIVRLTFKEGDTLEVFLQQISDATDLDYEEIKKEINDPEFLNELISEYSFLDESILNNKTYYKLEGYLFPNTYEIYKNASLKTIVKKMLDESKKRFNSISSSLEESDYSLAEILTMASIIEKEAVTKEDRKMVSQVIYTRLNRNMNLGMDVTSYYGAHKSMKEKLSDADLDDANPYNTRRSDFKGLPAGPICNPGLESIEAALNPSDTNYVYFYASTKTGQIKFTSDYNEFLSFKEEDK